MFQKLEELPFGLLIQWQHDDNIAYRVTHPDKLRRHNSALASFCGVERIGIDFRLFGFCVRSLQYG